MLYVDIPTLPEIQALVATRADACVSIYVSTTPHSQQVAASRIAFGNLTKSALEQLEASGFDKRRRALLEAEFTSLGEDDAFWRLQANSLAVLATPDSVRTFRLATAVTDMAEVSDRFHLKPLLRAIAFPQSAFVLALSENAVRLVEVSAELPPTPVHIPGLPDSAADASRKATINDRSPSGRIQGSEGQKVRLRQFARQVDAALRPVLAGRETPLILAATEPLASIYRAVNTYPALASQGISVGPDQTPDGELASATRDILDRHFAGEVEAARALFQTRAGQQRATSDIDEAARAATYGAIDLLLVDIDQVIHGTVDETDGSVTRASEAGTGSYGIVDEIAGRAILTGAKVLGVRSADIPGEAALAAILRYRI